ncbi:MAG: hypothetical protein R3B48_22665 [Kofleriaceae bacterium]
MPNSTPRATTIPLIYDEDDRPQRVAEVIELKPKQRRGVAAAPPLEAPPRDSDLASADVDGEEEVDDAAATNPLLRRSIVMTVADLDPATAEFAPTELRRFSPDRPARRAAPGLEAAERQRSRRDDWNAVDDARSRRPAPDGPRDDRWNSYDRFGYPLRVDRDTRDADARARRRNDHHLDDRANPRDRDGDARFPGDTSDPRDHRRDARLLDARADLRVHDDRADLRAHRDGPDRRDRRAGRADDRDDRDDRDRDDRDRDDRDRDDRDRDDRRASGRDVRFLDDTARPRDRRREARSSDDLDLRDHRDGRTDLRHDRDDRRAADRDVRFLDDTTAPRGRRDDRAHRRDRRDHGADPRPRHSHQGGDDPGELGPRPGDAFAPPALGSPLAPHDGRRELEPAFVEDLHRSAAAAPAPARRPDRPSRRAERVGKGLTVVSGLILAASVAVYGSQLWAKARRPTAPVTPPAPTVASALLVDGGVLELSADRRTLSRREGDSTRWTTSTPRALERFELAGPLVLGEVAETLSAFDLDSGRTRFTWELPVTEEWSGGTPVALGACLTIVTRVARKTSVRCLDVDTGAVTWVATLPRAQSCSDTAIGVPGAIVLPCSGWAAVLDARTGSVRVEPDAIGVLRRPEPYLVRLSRGVQLWPWSAERGRFVRNGALRFPATVSGSPSVVLAHQRLLVRASDASDDLVTLGAVNTPPVVVSSPTYRLAEETPLVEDCGGASPPRFQVLELAPRPGETFDPAAARDRALALLDTEEGKLVWTSHKLSGLLRLGAPAAPLCRDSYYFLPLELGEPTDPTDPREALWIVDARTGRTAATVGFDRALGVSLGSLSATHVDGERLVGVASGRAFEASWRHFADGTAPGLHDARAELEAALGPLP